MKRFVVVTIGVLGSLALAGGCSYDWSLPGGLDPNLPETSTPESGGSDVSKPDTAGDTAPPPDTGLPGESCKQSSDCGPKRYCDFADNSCGDTGPGKCTDIEFQPACVVKRPVCGCSKVVHMDSCDSTKAGDDLSVKALCTAPTDYFRCGALYCKETAEFCVRSGTKGDSCQEATGCTAPFKCAAGCTPIDSYASPCTCSDGAPGHVTVNCF